MSEQWRRLRRVGGSVVVMIGVASSSPGRAVAASPSSDEAALRALQAQMIEAWNRGDS